MTTDFSGSCFLVGLIDRQVLLQPVLNVIGL